MKKPAIASGGVAGDGQAPATSVRDDAGSDRHFGRLESVKVRDHWVDEARDFTPWLAKQENLDLLGDTIGRSLELVGIEQPVGPFKADVVVRDGERTVIIENQLDASDHKHLGQLLVYAAGRSATTVVWVAKAVTDEYRKVIDWLNEETSVDFWALEIELWRIGESPVAPKFNVVCAPNELSKPEPGEVSGIKLLQLEFWTDFSSYLESSGSSFNPRKARPQYRYVLPIGTTRANINLHAPVAFGSGVECGLYIKTRQAELIYETLAAEREAIDAELGMGAVEWDPLPEKQACRIGVHRDADLSDRGSWPELCKWLADSAERVKAVFAQRLQNMQLPSLDESAGQQPTDAKGSLDDSIELGAQANG